MIVVINTLKFKTTVHFEVKDKFLNLEVKCQRPRKVSGYSRKQARSTIQKKKRKRKKHYSKKGKYSYVTLTMLVGKTKSYMAPRACQLQYLINRWFSPWKSQDV